MIEVQIIKALVKQFPEIVPSLKGRARWIAYSVIPSKYMRKVIADIKTVDFFDRELSRMVQNLYDGNLSGSEFVDIMANLISGQLRQAFEQAWTDEGGEGDLPEYLYRAYEEMVVSQYTYVDSFSRDIIMASVDETPIDPLLARVGLWAERWNEAYNMAMLLIRSNEGGNLEWTLGETEEHCETCQALNGIVARASEWEELGVHPQGAPNNKIECGGWRCDCSLSPTDKRRSANAYGRIEEAIL